MYRFYLVAWGLDRSLPLMCLHVSWDGCWGTNVVSLDLLGQSAAVPVGVTIIGQVGRPCSSLLGLWLDCTAIPSQPLDCSPVLVSMLSLMLWMTLENHMVGSGVIKPPWSSLQACAFHVCGIILSIVSLRIKSFEKCRRNIKLYF